MGLPALFRIHCPSPKCPCLFKRDLPYNIRNRLALCFDARLIRVECILKFIFKQAVGYILLYSEYDKKIFGPTVLITFILRGVIQKSLQAAVFGK